MFILDKDTICKEREQKRLYRIFKKQFSELLEWINSSITPKKFLDYVEISYLDEREKNYCSIALYTFKARYYISIIKPIKERPQGYISPKIEQRVPDEGDNYILSSDLPDGPYWENSWLNVIDNIIGRNPEDGLLALVPLSEIY